ncbi:MAG: HD domain-containing protein [Lentisphaeria bacterium]|nr:HD domain-containing protein [Lentisphaeria bacterium]
MANTSGADARLPLNPALIERIYECASIRRWNDQVCPVEFTELDKQAHKMVIAYVLGRFEEDSGTAVDWRRLVEGGIFEMLHRIVLTDIKPPVFHRMMREKGPELNAWVLRTLNEEVRTVTGAVRERFERHLNDESYAPLEKRLLKAAHFLATQWEFNIIYRICPFVYGIERIKEEIEGQIEDHYDLVGVQKISLRRKTAGFVDLCGQLRFQQRWSQSPRIPKTSVLGHMLIVGIMTYFCLCELDACDRRLCNGFWAGLLHDLPEVLTRDITSPVKAAVEGLDAIIQEYERIHMEERLLPLLPPGWHGELTYFMRDEFVNKAMVAGQVRTGLSIEELGAKYNHDGANAVDGEVIRCCDHLAAFIEATLSISHGITSKHLTDGIERLLKQYRRRTLGTLDFGAVFRAFEPRNA